MNNRRPSSREPMLNISEPAPLVLAVILVLCHAGFLIAPDALQQTIRMATALVAQDGQLFFDGRPLGNYAPLLTHTLAHADWTHVLMNAAFIFIFGVLTIKATKNAHNPILGRIKRGPFVFLLIFLFGALLGGLAQWALWILINGSAYSIGASTGGAALFACAGWALGGKERMLGFIAIMMAIDAFIIFSGGSSSGLHNPAWAGHFGGFMAGAILAPKLLIPGGASSSRMF
ncbi:MAG: rhomboid family intramembrane serine protease [Hyphomonadaceae bacterium]|nr:rhomboid family intramembrane serine protease [Hyphomonadaceae bacterium]